MARNKTTTVYTFDELSEESKEKALLNFFNLFADSWWESIYEDAKNIGLKISGFDLDHGVIRGELTENFHDVCRKIRSIHGKDTEIYRTAKKFHKHYIETFIKYREEYKQDDYYADYVNVVLLHDIFYYEEDASKAIIEEFTQSLLEDYRIMLQKEYEYHTSREKIIEFIEDNEYEFTEDGKLS